MPLQLFSWHWSVSQWVSGCNFWILTQRVTFDTWDPSDIWSANERTKKTKKTKKRQKRQKDNKTIIQHEKNTLDQHEVNTKGQKKRTKKNNKTKKTKKIKMTKKTKMTKRQKRQKGNNTTWQKDNIAMKRQNETKRQKKRIKIESLILWHQGSFELLQCFNVVKNGWHC